MKGIGRGTQQVLRSDPTGASTRWARPPPPFRPPEPVPMGNSHVCHRSCLPPSSDEWQTRESRCSPPSAHRSSGHPMISCPHWCTFQTLGMKRGIKNAPTRKPPSQPRTCAWSYGSPPPPEMPFNDDFYNKDIVFAPSGDRTSPWSCPGRPGGRGFFLCCILLKPGLPPSQRPRQQSPPPPPDPPCSRRGGSGPGLY